jgi:hypothetical protein
MKFLSFDCRGLHLMRNFGFCSLRRVVRWNCSNSSATIAVLQCTTKRRKDVKYDVNKPPKPKLYTYETFVILSVVEKQFTRF